MTTNQIGIIIGLTGRLWYSFNLHVAVGNMRLHKSSSSMQNHNVRLFNWRIHSKLNNSSMNYFILWMHREFRDPPKECQMHN